MKGPGRAIIRHGLASTIALALVGCGRPSELELRFEAERLRWRIDRAEERLRGRVGATPEEELEGVRALHDEVHRRFGAESPPPPESLRDENRVLRLRIAAASSLYRADLAAFYDPLEKTVEEYERIASVYAFDRDLAMRALYGQGRLLEKLGRPDAALAAYRTLIERYPAAAERPDPESTRISPVPPLWLDLEIHALVLAKRVEGTRFATAADSTVARMRDRALAWRETQLGPDLARTAARAFFVCDRWSEGIALLQSRRDSIPAGEDRAAARFEIGELLARGSRDLAAAEAELRAAAEEAPGSFAEAAARLVLGQLFLESERASEGLREFDALLALRAHPAEGLTGEAGYGRAEALARLDRWEDAMPAYERVASLDDVGCWALLARRPLVERLRFLRVPGGDDRAVRESVEIARRIPSTRAPDPPFGWTGYWRTPRVDAAWRGAIEGLRELATTASSPEDASALREQADRFERERLFAARIGVAAGEVKIAEESAETNE